MDPPRPPPTPAPRPRLLGALSPLAAVLLLGACLTDEPLQQPAPLFEAAPFEFPLDLWDRGIEGETVLMIHITPVGSVDSAYVYGPSGHAAFDSSALAGAHRLRFTPGRRGDKRVDVWAKLPVRFTKSGPGTGGIMVMPPPAEPDTSSTPDDEERREPRSEHDLRRPQPPLPMEAP